MDTFCHWQSGRKDKQPSWNKCWSPGTQDRSVFCSREGGSLLPSSHDRQCNGRHEDIHLHNCWGTCPLSNEYIPTTNNYLELVCAWSLANCDSIHTGYGHVQISWKDSRLFWNETCRSQHPFWECGSKAQLFPECCGQMNNRSHIHTLPLNQGTFCRTLFCTC